MTQVQQYFLALPLVPASWITMEFTATHTQEVENFPTQVHDHKGGLCWLFYCSLHWLLKQKIPPTRGTFPRINGMQPWRLTMETEHAVHRRVVTTMSSCQVNSFSDCHAEGCWISLHLLLLLLQSSDLLQASSEDQNLP